MKILLTIAAACLMAGCNYTEKTFSPPADVTFINGTRVKCSKMLMTLNHVSFDDCDDGNEYPFQTNFVVHNPKEIEAQI